MYKSRSAIIEGVLYPGTYLLAGAPKIGKSFLVAQLAYHVSTGKELWGYQVTQGTVLYLALEDDHRRLQERMYRMFGTDSSEKLFFATCAKQIGNGLEDQLKKFMQKHSDTKLVILDTLQKIREVGNEKNSYAKDYEIIGKLRTPNKTEKRSKRQQGRKKPNGYQPCVHIGRAGACIDGTRQRFAQQPSGAFQDERNCPPHVWQCGALYVSLCTPVCKTENRTLYQREVSEDDKWVSRANFAGTADDPAYIPAFCNHSHWRQ